MYYLTATGTAGTNSVCSVVASVICYRKLRHNDSLTRLTGEGRDKAVGPSRSAVGPAGHSWSLLSPFIQLV